MTVGYQAWNHFGAEGVWTTSELVVAASGAEARVVGTASGSGYQGAVFVPHQSGVQAHLPGDMASGGACWSAGRSLPVQRPGGSMERFLKPLGAGGELSLLLGYS